MNSALASTLVRKANKHVLDGKSEFFLFEFPANNYQPPPPDGWFALRSSKCRIFMQLNNGAVLRPDEITARLKAGEFIEHPIY